MQITRCGIYNYRENNINKAYKTSNKRVATNSPNNEPSYQTNVLNYSYNVNFGALNWVEINKYTKELSRRIYSKRHINEFDQIYRNADGITAGNGLPELWTSRIKDIANFDKDSFIESLGKIFSEEREFTDMKRLKNSLIQLFRKHNIIDEDNLLDVQYIGQGFHAWAYKISLLDEKANDVVVKLFKRHDNIIQNHGNKTEQNLAEYVRTHTNNDSEFVKYYYGDTKNGIILVDYIPKDAAPPKKKLDLEDIGIVYGDDFPKNRINGHICDYGGIETLSNLIGNVPAQEVHRSIKYAASDEERIRIFNELYESRDNTDEFKDKAIGLVHAVKFMPKEMQAELYKKCYALESHRVNIALIQNIKNFSELDGMEEMLEKLVLESHDQKEQEIIAKEIRHVPDRVRHLYFEQQTNSTVSAIVKYLARNINHYYKDMPNRRNIYNTFISNCDTYSGLALINSMRYMSPSRYDEYFEAFYSKENPALNTALARSLEFLKGDTNTQQKWINKLLECDDVYVNAGLAESIAFVNEENRAGLIARLLPSKDKVIKEFIAQNIITVPMYTSHPEWLAQLLDGADNMVKEILLKTIESTPNGSVKTNWIKIITESLNN